MIADMAMWYRGSSRQKKHRAPGDRQRYEPVVHEHQPQASLTPDGWIASAGTGVSVGPFGSEPAALAAAEAQLHRDGWVQSREQAERQAEQAVQQRQAGYRERRSGY